MAITFISAGAGSGKTTRLMELISEAIGRGESPERIVATTFTVKAAEEIKSRIQQKFLEEGDFEKANAASAIMVGTINSVCGRLLSLFAFESGMSPQLGVLDEASAEVVFRRVIDATIDESVTAEFHTLETRFGVYKNESQWQGHVKKIIDAARSAHIDTVEFPAMAQKNADAILHCIGAPLINTDHAMLNLLDDAIPAIKNAQKIKELKNTQDYLDHCISLQKGIHKELAAWDIWIKLETKIAGKNCGEWANSVKELAATWKTHPQFHTDVRRYLDLVFTTASAVIQAYDTEKKLLGMLDFTDQEVKLYDLLEKKEVQERLKERMGLLLVDEFQDTSPIQLALFVKLASFSSSTYFVGDVKQAIYGFRGSDSALMEGILEEFRKNGTPINILPNSYRSRSSLVSLVNSIFIPAFSNELDDTQVALQPVRAEIPGEAFMHWVLDGSNIEAQTVNLAGGIISLFESDRQVFDKESKSLRSLRWSDIAVLVRSNADVVSITSAFASAGIPLRYSELGLLSTPEAHLILASLRRLNDSYDTLASAEILGLTESLSPEDWLAERLEWNKNDSIKEKSVWRCTGENSNTVLATLEEIRPLVDQLGPSALLDTLFARCGFEKYVLSWVPDESTARQRLANLEAVRSLVRTYEDSYPDGACTLAGLILWLAEQADGADVLPDSPVDGVSVTTWHKAKGLEWPIVILHGSWKSVHDVAWNTIRILKDTPLDLDNPLAGAWIRFWPWPFGRLKKVDGVDLARDPHVTEMVERNNREERRLLYVGVTRARDLLIVAIPGKTIKADAAFTSLGIGQNLYAEPQEGETSIRLTDGTSISYACLTPQASVIESAQTTGDIIKWFDTEYRSVEYPRARLTPSSEKGEVGQLEQISQLAPDSELSVCAGKTVRNTILIPRIAGVDMREFGNLYHAAFAFYAHNLEYTGKSQFSKEIAIAARGMVSLMKEQWPDSVFHTELAVCSSITDGRYIDARIDLLVETEKGVFIVDHKLSEKPHNSTDEMAKKYTAQLESYKAAVEAKQEKPVLGMWISLPQDGMLVEIV